MGIAQQSLWEKYRSQGHMPPKWTQADSDQAFPQFTLCNSHWKLRHFASDNYLSCVNASDQTPSSEAWPTVPSLAMLHHFKRSKSCGTSQYPTTSQLSCASLIDAATPARPSTSTTSPSAPVPDVDDMLLGSAGNASIQGITSILHDVQRRQALLTKLSLNEQATAPKSPLPDVPVAMPTPSITPPASNLLEQDFFDVATACLPCPALEHDGVIPTTLSPLPGTSWQPLVSSAADSAPITSPSITKTKLCVNKTSMTARHRFALAYTAKAPTATIDEVLHAFEMAPEDDIKTFREAVVAHTSKVKKTHVLKGKERALQLGIDHR
ncbi:hypothetical protein BD414DRAFT_479608 [Trametes punicea]|nr:hypothetical protein BD414DRAFT_479608 [Trametes punicea]